MSIYFVTSKSVTEETVPNGGWTSFKSTEIEVKSNSQFYHGEIDIRELLFSEENVDFIEAKISGPSPIYNIFVEKFKEEYEKNIILK